MIRQQSLATRQIDPAESFVKALAARDPDAWRELFDEQYARVYRYAYLRTGNSADAEDVASSVFAAAVRGIGRYRFHGAPVAAWLFRIAHHKTADLLKRRRRDRSAVVDGSDAGVLASDGAIDRALELREVSDALALLRDEQRDVLVLRLVEGRSIEEVACLLGKSSGAVKMIQARALKALRAKLPR
jgi:RNA polymerase sigma-70 factor, ECF subfamily